MINLINVDCPICEKDASTPLFEVEELSLVKCKKCGLMYYNPNISLQDHYAFLNEDFFVSPAIQQIKKSGQRYDFAVYMQHVKHPSIVGYPDYLEPEHLRAKELWGKKLLSWFIKDWQIQKFKGLPSSVLEMGAATGHMLHPFKDAEWRCLGQEVSCWIVDHSSSRVDVLLGELHNLSFGDEKFNCVILWDSFEHTQFPNECLKKLHEITTDEMLMIIQTPNAEYITTEDHYLLSPRQHSFLFSKRTLSLILKKCGFEICNERISSQADEMCLIVKKLLKGKNRKNG